MAEAISFKKPTDLQQSKGLRKLTVIPSPEGKSRVIAMLDYWSQSVLKPIHD